MDSQWHFPLDSLRKTPSAIALEEEMLRRQRGVDWLMRVGATLNMCVSQSSTSRSFRLISNERAQGIGALLDCRSIFTPIL